jgi:hypothetical protein
MHVGFNKERGHSVKWINSALHSTERKLKHQFQFYLK